MAQKCALIVDDSKTARRFLGTLLQKHGIRVESAESAESALEFLCDTRPDVIFMDHMMPGMDGFQAVRAIKDNPDTATIPIMMYTSQEGELYVGQARALGAVGVLPKQIKPVEVSAMLESLHLIPTVDEVVRDEGVIEDVAEPVQGRPVAAVERMMEPANWGELHGWFEEMLNHHGRALRGDIENSVARLLDQHSQRDPVQEEMSAEEVLRVIDQIAVVGKVPSVSFTGGECTLRPELPEFIAHARKRGMRVNIITNGVTCSSRAYVDKLVAAGLTSAQVSVEGPDAEIHEVECALQSFESVKAAAEFLSQLSGEGWLVLGDMKELGADAAELHREVGEAAQKAGVDRLFALGDLSRFAVEGFGEHASWYGSIDVLVEELSDALGDSVNVLVKGSRSMHMERVVDALRDVGPVRREA